MIKQIFILWFQGFDMAPDVVKTCVKSWKYYNPDWKIVLLDANTLNQYMDIDKYITDDTGKKFTKTALSDIIRCTLLKVYGGVWVDATTFCNKPLNDWLPQYSTEGFFAFSTPGPDRLLSSWFLYSDINNYILDKWFNKTIEYYERNTKPHTYYWFHYLFGYLYTADNVFKEMWDNVPKLSANRFGPHYLLKKGLFNTITPNIKLDIDTKRTPLYKLTHKANFPEYNDTKNIYYLYSTLSPLPEVEIPETEIPETEISEVEIPEVEMSEVEIPAVKTPAVKKICRPLTPQYRMLFAMRHRRG